LSITALTYMLQIRQIRDILTKALNLAASPRVDVRQFLAFPQQRFANDPAALNAPPDCPALFIYLLSIFSKTIIAQLVSEVGSDPKRADPVGIAAITIFAHKDFTWHNTSLIDILLAKFHKVCPILWGLKGSEETEQGRARLGWAKDFNGQWVDRQVHFERMTGLGAGFAALSLRNLTKSRNDNPFPNSEYWKALAWVAGVTPDQATETHFVLLKAIVENSEARFVSFYGNHALSAYKKALVELPSQIQKHSAASRATAVMADVFAKDHHLHLKQ
jgi:nucleoporin GLE1